MSFQDQDQPGQAPEECIQLARDHQARFRSAAVARVMVVVKGGGIMMMVRGEVFSSRTMRFRFYQVLTILKVVIMPQI